MAQAPGPLSPPAGDIWATSVLAKGAVICVYLCLNVALNMINKWTLTFYGFHFPILLSVCHQVFSVIALAPLMASTPYRQQHRRTLGQQWLGLIGITSFFTISLGCNNYSLVSIPLSMNQMIRACIPVATATASVFLEAKTPTRQEAFSLVILVIGTGITVFEGSSNHKATWMGIIMCIIGTVSNGCMLSMTGRLLSEKLDVWRLTFYTAPLTATALLPFFYSTEAEGFAKYQAVGNKGYIGVLLLGCCIALVYNMVHSLVIKVTSAVTTTVLGEMKIVFILVLSSLFLEESDIYTLKMLVGVSTTVVGFTMYSHARLSTTEWAAQQPSVIKGMPQVVSDSEGTRLLGGREEGGLEGGAHQRSSANSLKN